MKRSRFIEEQVIAYLKEQESGVATADVCRRHGMSGATFYKWKVTFDGLEVSDARRPRAPFERIRGNPPERRRALPAQGHRPAVPAGKGGEADGSDGGDPRPDRAHRGAPGCAASRR